MARLASTLRYSGQALALMAACHLSDSAVDIGTGSGILALMMAQRNYKTEIDAIEIDPNATILARQNVALSPWPEQIHVLNTSLQHFYTGKQNTYSLIICNPPFFTDSLKAPDLTRSLARHDDALPVNDLLEFTSKLLTEHGRAAFIIPVDAFEKWFSIAIKFSLYPARITKIKSSANHKHHRVLVVFSGKDYTEIIENELCIYKSAKIYTDEYRELTKEFYLHF